MVFTAVVIGIISSNKVKFLLDVSCLFKVNLNETFLSYFNTDVLTFIENSDM